MFVCLCVCMCVCAFLETLLESDNVAARSKVCVCLFFVCVYVRF